MGTVKHTDTLISSEFLKTVPICVCQGLGPLVPKELSKYSGGGERDPQIVG